MLSNHLSLILISIIFISIFFINYIYLKFYKKNNYIKKNRLLDNINFNELMNNSMASILFIFGLLKLYNLNKFSSIFSKYNIISKKIPFYSYLYPFIEIILSFNLFLNYKINLTYIIINILMLISLISVIISIIKGKKIRCGCLGSFFHIPLSYVTISENIIMLLMINFKIINIK